MKQLYLILGMTLCATFIRAQGAQADTGILKNAPRQDVTIYFSGSGDSSAVVAYAIAYIASRGGVFIDSFVPDWVGVSRIRIDTPFTKPFRNIDLFRYVRKGSMCDHVGWRPAKLFCAEALQCLERSRAAHDGRSLSTLRSITVTFYYGPWASKVTHVRVASSYAFLQDDAQTLYHSVY